MSTTRLEKAQSFIWNNARLLERQYFSFLFDDGSRQNVLRALVAYQNSDGGFGNALEPDKRTPSSQPIDQEFALRILDDIGFDQGLAGDICEYLETITTDRGGVPFVLPTVSDAPRAPWWNSEANPPASINPTASIAGLLHKHKFEHPWLVQATEFCWQKIEALLSASDNDLLCIVLFLENAPDKERAAREFEPIGEIIKQQVALDPMAEGYVHKPLDWAPNPDSLCSGLFVGSLIEPHLEALAARQQTDGGWPVSWPATSPASLLEFRSVVTIQALKTLKAYEYPL